MDLARSYTALISSYIFLLAFPISIPYGARPNTPNSICLVAFESQKRTIDFSDKITIPHSIPFTDDVIESSAEIKWHAITLAVRKYPEQTLSRK